MTSPRSGLTQVVLDCPPHVAEKQHVNSWQLKKEQLWAEELLSCWVPQKHLIKETKGHAPPPPSMPTTALPTCTVSTHAAAGNAEDAEVGVLSFSSDV